jgi:DNA-binding NarL/FixJ family response regulator
MNASRLAVSLGLDRLFHEIVAAALAAWGWHLLDVEEGHPFSIDAAEIVLVSGIGTVDALIDRVRSAKERFPSGRVVLFGSELSDYDLVRLIEAGTAAHVSNTDNLGELIDVLEMVRNNCAPSSGRITQLVLNTIRQRSREQMGSAEPQLTMRESEILRLIRAGLSNKEIAVQLRIAPNTVKNHVHHLLEKLKVRSRHEAAWLEARSVHGLLRASGTGTDI